MREGRQKEASEWEGGLMRALLPPETPRSGVEPLGAPHPQLPAKGCLPARSGDNSTCPLFIRQSQLLTCTPTREVWTPVPWTQLCSEISGTRTRVQAGVPWSKAPSSARPHSSGWHDDQSGLWKVASASFRYVWLCLIIFLKEDFWWHLLETPCPRLPAPCLGVAGETDWGTLPACGAELPSDGGLGFGTGPFGFGSGLCHFLP